MGESTARHLPPEVWRIIANLEAENALSKDGFCSSRHCNDNNRDANLDGRGKTLLDLKDRAKLSRVCKAARVALLPTLYRRLDLRRNGSQKLLRTLSEKPELAALIQTVFWDISIDAMLPEPGEADDTPVESPTPRARILHPLATDARLQEDVRPAVQDGLLGASS